MNKGAIFSEGRKYRYELWRSWDDSRSWVTFVCLNPSTANEDVDDPTVRRIIGFAKQWGFGGMRLHNLFAFVTSNPKELSRDAIGPRNDQYLRDIAGACVAAWGNHGNLFGRSAEVRRILQCASCFGLTKQGEPMHPLYLPKSAELVPLEVG